jgi:hypothetical protein
VHIKQPHNVGKKAAIRKIDAFLDDLMRQRFPGGITVKEASKSWSDNAMRFSFKAQKGFIGATISGAIVVNGDSVVIDFELPRLVKTFVSEGDVRDAIKEQLDGLFPA